MVSLIKNILNLFFDNTCPSCHKTLYSTDECICLECIYSLPKTNNYLKPNNDAEIMMAGRFPFERIATYCKFTKGGLVQPLIHCLKYKNNKEIGIKLGRLFGKDIAASSFINKVDYIVPVPLHKKKLKTRGFNQAEVIAQGISELTEIPLSTNNLIRQIHNPSQTKLSKSQRWDNVEGIFKLVKPNQYKNKHILLIDDIITTGSTIEACANALLEAKGVKISIATIGEAIQK